MSAGRSRCDRATTAAAVLLLLCSLGCLCIADATRALERSNQRRRDQLLVLAERLEQVEPAPPGPLAVLDGLFARRLEQLETAAGGMLAFVGADCGGNP